MASNMMLARELAEQQYTISAAIAFGWASMEYIVHLPDDLKLLRHWRWGHTVYFACRYFGLLSTMTFLILACVGNKANAKSLCQGFYILEHITASLLFVSTGAMFWIRAGFVCEWQKKILLIPLAIYGLVIAALAMSTDISDYRQTNFIGQSSAASSSLVCAIKINGTANRIQALVRFAMALFDVLTAAITFTYLYKKRTAQTWLTTILTRDQLIYVGATTLIYIALGMNLLLSSEGGVAYFGVFCPSVISIICCRLFLRLKKKGSGHHLSVTSLDIDLSSPTHSPSRSKEGRSSRLHKSYQHEDYALQGPTSSSSSPPWSTPSQVIASLERVRTTSQRDRPYHHYPPHQQSSSQKNLVHTGMQASYSPSSVTSQLYATPAQRTTHRDNDDEVESSIW